MSQASITRSSQPMVGLKNSRSAQDEKLVECIFSSHNFPDTAYAPPASPLSPVVTSAPLPVYGATTTNLIIDARPTTNAMANVAMGAGTENMDNYKAGKKAYLGIDNIHVMRNSLKAIVEALREAEAASAPLDRGLLRKSNWLRHTSTILDGALIIVRNVHLNASHVLIHCSDGWDRTAQLSAVAQICLDPYYRTLEGLKVLIEKDWLAFGHKFLDRSGHLSSDKLFTVTNTPEEDSDDENFGAQKAAQAFFASMQKQFTSSNSHLREISPVFHQFLDCVRQIQRQYPERFQFNEEFLVDIHYHLYSCQFGTFLFNSEHQRRVPHTGKAYMDRTVPAWDYFDGASQLSKYLNENFDRSLDDRDSRIADADQGVLLPDPKDVRFWHRLFKRGDEEMNGSKLALAQQATGAELLGAELLGAELLGPVGAGQVDPISVEGVVERVASPLHVPYAARSRGPSPTPSISTSAPDLIAIAKDPSQPLPSASSISSLPPPNPAREGTKNPLYRISRGGLPSGPSGSGWGWSQLGSGALSAIQGAAREIKTISTEAVNQIRAEGGEAQGEMWTKGDKDEVRTGIGEGRGGRDTPGTTIPRVTTRVPSEANPWSTTPTTDIPSRIPSITPPTMTTTREQPDAQIQTQSQLQPHARREASWNKNPWGEVEVNKPDIMRKASPLPALGELSLREDKKTINGGPAVAPAETVRKEELDAALGGDRNAWDPLGAM